MYVPYPHFCALLPRQEDAPVLPLILPPVCRAGLQHSRDGPQSLWRSSRLHHCAKDNPLRRGANDFCLHDRARARRTRSHRDRENRQGTRHPYFCRGPIPSLRIAASTPQVYEPLCVGLHEGICQRQGRLVSLRCRSALSTRQCEKGTL